MRDREQELRRQMQREWEWFERHVARQGRDAVAMTHELMERMRANGDRMYQHSAPQQNSK